MLLRLSVVSLLLLLLSSCATQSRPTVPSGSLNPVQAAPTFSPYAGLGLGTSFLNANTTDLPLIQDQSFSLAGQVTLGLSFGSNLAFEFRAADLGEATFTNGAAVGYQVADVSGLLKTTRNRLTGFARLGAGALYNDGDIATAQDNPTHLLIGAGVDYALSPKFSLRAEWQGHDVDVMHSQISVLYRIGTPAKQAPVVIAQNRTQPEVVEAPKARAPKQPAPKPVAKVPTITERPKARVTPTEKPTQIAKSTQSIPAKKPVPVAKPAPAIKAQAPKPEVQTPKPQTQALQEPAGTSDVKSPTVIVQKDANKEWEELPVPPSDSQTPAVAKKAPAATDKAASQAAKPVDPGSEQLAMASPEPENTGSTRLKPLITVPVPKKNVPVPTDKDKDGIFDASDVCPGTRAGEPVLSNGCALFNESVSGLKFVPGTDELTKSAKTVLDEVADVLSDKADIRMTVAAHTAPAEDAQSAMFLTRRRTISIIRYLSDRGIDSTRLRPEAYGDSQPLASAGEASENERVVFSQR